MERYRKRRYYRSIDFMKALLIICLIFVYGGFPIEKTKFLQPLFNFASCTLFTLYGYLVLRDGVDLRKNILHTFKVFCILFAVYFVFTFFMKWIFLGSPFFKFNIWQLLFFNNNTFGTTFSMLWITQSILYALCFFYLTKRLKDFDWIICIIFFAISIIFCDLASFFGISDFLESTIGYKYIPQCFITKTIPYMLLGRIIHKNIKLLFKLTDFMLIEISVVGALFCVAEFFLLYRNNYLVCWDNLFGFIIISSTLTIWCVKNRMTKKRYNFLNFAPTFNKWLFYLSMPICVIFYQLSYYFSFHQNINMLIGVFTVLTAGGFSVLVSYLKYKKDKKTEKINNENDAQTI